MYAHNDFAFHHVPKTGGMSVKKMLHLTGASMKQVAKDHILLDSWKGHRCLKKYKHIYTNVRDPFARIVSLYKFWTTRRGEMSFDKFFYDCWLAKKKLYNPFRHTTDEYILVKGKVPENVTIIKLEEINEMWPQIINHHFGKKFLSVPRENTTYHKNPMEYFNDEMVNIMKKKEGWVIRNYYPQLA